MTPSIGRSLREIECALCAQAVVAATLLTQTCGMEENRGMVNRLKKQAPTSAMPMKFLVCVGSRRHMDFDMRPLDIKSTNYKDATAMMADWKSRRYGAVDKIQCAKRDIVHLVPMLGDRRALIAGDDWPSARSYCSMPKRKSPCLIEWRSMFVLLCRDPRPIDKQ